MATTVTVKTKNHLVSIPALAQAMWSDLTTGGSFTSILPAGSTTPPVVDVDGNCRFVVETTSTVNPLNATQPYRILVDVLENARMRVSIANPMQITDQGVVASYPGVVADRLIKKVGMLGTNWSDTNSTGGALADRDYPTDSQFLVRDLTFYPEGDLSGSPLSYSLTITDHGISFFAWGDDMDQNPRSSWFVVQNPVDKTTGLPRLDKNSPIFCVYSTNTCPDGIATASETSNWITTELANCAAANASSGQPVVATVFATWLKNQLTPPIGGMIGTGGPREPNSGWIADTVGVYKFVVNESDVFVPSQSVRADLDRIDSSAIINTNQQVAIATGNQYLVTIPNRLNTQRYAYTDELDLIGYTSADVISQDSNVPVTVYGESSPRSYKAMKATGANNTGVRLLVLVAMGV